MLPTPIASGIESLPTLAICQLTARMQFYFAAWQLACAA